MGMLGTDPGEICDPVVDEKAGCRDRSQSVSVDTMCTLADLNTDLSQIDDPPHAEPSLESMYVLGEVIDEGEFGVVRKAVNKRTGDTVAIKTVKHADLMSSDEVRLQQMVDHCGVVKIFYVLKGERHSHIVMEYMANGSLFDLLCSGRRLSETEARKYFTQVIDAVDACHRAHIAHRDLKVENILLDENDRIKLADFGLAAEIVPEQLLSGRCGSLNYAAPEVWSRDAQYQGQGADVWSCGAVLYALLTGSTAYDADDVQTLIRKVRNADYYVNNRVSDEGNDLLAKIFQVDPAKRICIEDIRKHPWFLQD